MAAYLKDRHNQQTMNRYTTPIPKTRGKYKEQETRLSQPTHRERCNDTNTTQQQMMAFFPGQPQDILQEVSQSSPPSQVWRDIKIGYQVRPWKCAYKMLSYLYSCCCFFHLFKPAAMFAQASVLFYSNLTFREFTFRWIIKGIHSSHLYSFDHL